MVMQEGQTTIGGVNHRLPRPFMVMATQNPIDEEGPYVLPEDAPDRVRGDAVVLGDEVRVDVHGQARRRVPQTLLGRFDVRSNGKFSYIFK